MLEVTSEVTIFLWYLFLLFKVAARLVENIAEIAYTIANFLERTGVNREEVDKMVKIIQVAFRKYLSVRPQARPNGKWINK